MLLLQQKWKVFHILAYLPHLDIERSQTVHLSCTQKQNELLVFPGDDLISQPIDANVIAE